MKKQTRTGEDQRSELDVGQAAKPVKKAHNDLTKEEKISESQDIPASTQLIGFEETLHIFRLLICIYK